MIADRRSKINIDRRRHINLFPRERASRRQAIPLRHSDLDHVTHHLTIDRKAPITRGHLPAHHVCTHARTYVRMHARTQVRIRTLCASGKCIHTAKKISNCLCQNNIHMWHKCECLVIEREKLSDTISYCYCQD